ncbi:MAG: aminotransferase class V-fold PLP-dependent enzyme [Planctomycetota bacterium]
MRRLGYRVVDLIVAHLSTLSAKRVVRRGTAQEFATLVDEALPLEGRGADDTLRFFAERVLPGMTLVNHPRFHAYIPCPGSFLGTLGAMLAAGTNPFTGTWLGGATLASLELTVLRWLSEAIGYPSDAAGLLTSGGSMANLIGLAAARTRSGCDKLESMTLYFSAEGHASVEKAARLLAFPARSLRQVPADSSFRMRTDALLGMIEEDERSGRYPTAVCANAGTTNTGSIDPLVEVAAICERHGIWLHVDGAYGGFAAITPEGRSKLAGMERADSLTLDPHKWLYSPMGTGCILVRDRARLEQAFASQAAYLRDIPRDEVNFHERGPELSRPGRVLAVWMLLRSAGLHQVSEQISHDLRLARRAAELIAGDPRFELVVFPELSVVTFRHAEKPGESEEARAARDAALMERTLAEGTIMLSTTLLNGRTALRLVVMNPRTDEAELLRSLEAIRKPEMGEPP